MKSTLTLFLFIILTSSFTYSAEAPPNILFILVDDQRNDTLGCAGHKHIKTPTIDRLATEGVRFENMFVNTAICMASRATIFTGLTETSHGFTGGGPPAVPIQKIDVDSSFPVLLRNAGYRNGFYGKQHVKFSEKNKPALSRMFNDHKVYNGGPHFVKRKDGSKRHSAEVIGDHSVTFLETQPKDQPFCLYMSFNIAHAVDHDHTPGTGHFPWPKAVDGMYDDIVPEKQRLADPKYFDMQPDFLKHSLNRVRWYWRWDTPEKYNINMRAYYRMLSGMDGVIARVQHTLKKEGFAKNTIIIYTADNGYYMGNRGFAGKWSHYDESLRVPLIIYDPRAPQSKRDKLKLQMVQNLDLPATMLDFANVNIPKKYQGKSLRPILAGKHPTNWRKDIYNEHHYNHKNLPKWRGVRGKRYTYAHYYQAQSNNAFLYDLKSDPDQLVNLANDQSYKKVLKKMQARTDAFQNMYTRPEIELLRKKK